MKENVAVFFGGESCEHDISIISAMQVINNIDKNFYNIIPIYLTKNSRMYIGKNFDKIENFTNVNLKKDCEVTLNIGSNYLLKKNLFGYKKYLKIDVALVIMHGINGEDGKLMALLDLCKIPYNAPNYVSSALCLDKCLFKTFVNSLHISSIKSVNLIKKDYYNNPENCKQKIIKKINFPIIIKPANLGSSIGIKVVKSINDFDEKVNYCFKYCNKLLIEKYLTDFIEFNIALLFDGNKIIFSKIEQPIKQSDILSFDNKYSNNSTMNSMKKIDCNNLDEKIIKKIKLIAKRLFIELNLKGVVRFDFIYDNLTNKLFINEINTIPGSLAYYLFKENNIDFKTLINKIIKGAYLDFENNNKIITKFNSNVLDSLNCDKLNKYTK